MERSARRRNTEGSMTPFEGPFAHVSRNPGQREAGVAPAMDVGSEGMDWSPVYGTTRPRLGRLRRRAGRPAVAGGAGAGRMAPDRPWAGRSVSLPTTRLLRSWARSPPVHAHWERPKIAVERARGAGRGLRCRIGSAVGFSCLDGVKFLSLLPDETGLACSTGNRPHDSPTIAGRGSRSALFPCLPVLLRCRHQ